jgi:nucleotide-binding universal stress UspA family protein
VFVVAEFEKAVLRGFKKLRRRVSEAARAKSRFLHKEEEHLVKPRSLLATIDFSVDSRNAAYRAALLAAELRSALKLLHVVDETSLKAVRELIRSHDDAEAKLIGHAQHLLDEVRSEVVEKTQVAAISRVTIGRVLEEILSAAEQSDLLVLGARGLNPLRDLLVGMTVDRVLQIYKRQCLSLRSRRRKVIAESWFRSISPYTPSPH